MSAVVATAAAPAFFRALEALRFSLFAAAFSSAAFCTACSAWYSFLWAFVYLAGAGESGRVFSKGAGAADLGLVQLLFR